VFPLFPGSNKKYRGPKGNINRVQARFFFDTEVVALENRRYTRIEIEIDLRMLSDQSQLNFEKLVQSSITSPCNPLRT
jgi:hypothetical protein